MTSRCLLLIAVCWSIQANGQEAEAKVKRPNVIIISKYDDVIKGRLSRIVNDSLFFIAQAYNSDSSLHQFYLGTHQREHFIYVDYIKSVTIRDGRVLGTNTALGAIAGGIIAGFIGYQVSKNEGHTVLKNFGSAAIGAAAGVLIGAPIGFFTGIFARKKFYVNGNPKQLDKLQQYVF